MLIEKMANEGIITHIFGATKMLQKGTLRGSVDVKMAILLLKNAAIGGNIAKSFDEP